MCTNSMRELEEERRLLYVAITRAEKHCIMTCAQNRFRYGRMEYDTPSRFIRDIDPELLDIEGESWGQSHSASGRGSSFGGSRSPEWMQNPRPVATQFKADPKPRAVAPRQAEKPVDPFGPNFKRLYQTVAPNGSLGQGRSATPSAQSQAGAGDLREGCQIEHQRFGVGTVIKIEGTGENTKATVTFCNVGTKQLLLKFAKFKIL